MATLDPTLWRPAKDLNAPRFVNEIILLSDLFRAGLAKRETVITKRTFVNCRLEGPAVFMALGRVQIDNCNLGDSDGDVRNLLFKPMSPNRVTGTIPFGDCDFEACSFFSVGFTGPQAFLDQFLAIPPEELR